jgi:Na+/H+ antiporter NhaD/arsenite permease-like protein
MLHRKSSSLLLFFALLIAPTIALAATAGHAVDIESLKLWAHPLSYFALVTFVLSYIVVLTEERSHMKKSKPVMLGAGIIWVIIGIVCKIKGVDHHDLRTAIFHGLDEYGSLLLFLLAAMTYIEALKDRKVFSVLRAKLVQAGLNLRQLFWVTGILAFFLSPIADNLTTALVLGAVVMAVGKGDPKFIALGCVNIVNAANAGGAFSPFGDITTLMVWQAQKAEFFEFFALFIPSVVMFLIPALAMSFFVSKEKPPPLKESVTLKRGAKRIIFLGIMTICMAVGFENFLGLPPFLGMMTGMSILMINAYFIRKFGVADKDFDVLELVAAAEWDTLLFFFGVIFSVGGLSYLGYLGIASNFMYDGMGASATNIFLGFASAIIDNIPVMFAVLSMDPVMDKFQWLLITLTTGVGGSMLSIGSAAGVALMGTARGYYTFFYHLKWAPVIMVGYAAAIGAHFLVNGDLMADQAIDAVSQISETMSEQSAHH